MLLTPPPRGAESGKEILLQSACISDSGASQSLTSNDHAVGFLDWDNADAHFMGT